MNRGQELLQLAKIVNECKKTSWFWKNPRRDQTNPARKRWDGKHLPLERTVQTEPTDD